MDGHSKALDHRLGEEQESASSAQRGQWRAALPLLMYYLHLMLMMATGGLLVRESAQGQRNSILSSPFVSR
jgi:hypothetical protein